MQTIPHSTISMVLPKEQWWRPKDDISAYELALALPVLILMGSRPHSFNVEDAVKALPVEVARHFTDQRPVAFAP